MSQFTESVDNKVLIGYACDIEGDYSFWQSYIKVSKVLSLNNGKLKLKDGCHFVYGGDVCDRGTGDCRLLADLIQLKDEYVDRVHFIIGNRDANKLRLPFILSKSLKTSYKTHWKSLEETTESSREAKLKWVLTDTMGAPLSFDLRRQELTDMKMMHEEEDVVASFLRLIEVDGLLLKYLSYGKIAVQIGDTLFVHGALQKDSAKWVPPAYSDVTNASRDKVSCLDAVESERLGSHKETLKDWIEAINAWASSEVEHFKASYSDYIDNDLKSEEDSWDVVGGYEHPQPGSRLVMYGMGKFPDDSKNPTVVYASNYALGTLTETDPEVLAYFKQANVNRIVSGHQPQGDAPFILDRNDGIQCISADTGYSRYVEYKFDDDDGWMTYENHCKEKNVEPLLAITDKKSTRSPLQISEVCIVQEKKSEKSRAFVYGRLSEGSIYAYETSDKYLGKELGDNWFVKAANIQFSSDLYLTSGAFSKNIDDLMNDVGKLNSSEGRRYLLTWTQQFSNRARIVSQNTLDRLISDNNTR